MLLLCLLPAWLGGAGGGIIHLIVDDLHNDGTISANGGGASDVISGGGSGGSILVESREVDGLGRFQVNILYIIFFLIIINLNICLNDTN